MRKTKFMIASAILAVSMIGTTFAAVPDYYRANYSIAKDWENIKKIFIEIQANSQIGEAMPAETFQSLNQSFNNVFPKFPQEYNFQIVYQKCKTLSQNLGNGYNYNTFVSFMDNCFTPLSSILNTIDSTYTVKPNIVVNPSSGPAPLTVTFNASASIDPSSETIPENNYFWYYRDINGVDQVIGNKSVISYTFENAGNHIVHLTVRSSNVNNGIFDGEKDVSVNVKPMSASISVYANGKKLDRLDKLKFGTQEGVNGVVLDGSATIPIGGRVILQHFRKIEGGNGFSFKKNGDGIPGIIKVVLPNEGEYKITLTTKDNEGNEISETYSIVLADPVAIIKDSPEAGTTSTKYTFDASSSYSVTSSIKLYTREIFDFNGSKKATYQGKTIYYQFKEPGSYTVKLTVTDNLGESNTDVKQIYVESSAPVAQFTFKPDSNWTYPSKFILDASSSSDVDLGNFVDKLTYERSFSNPETTNIQSIEGDNKIVRVTFDTVGEQKVKLTVMDKYSKIDEIEKTIKVESVLRPEITVIPKASVRGNPIRFVVQSNKNLISYNRNFGDQSNNSVIKTNKISHIFSKIGTYIVTLKVNGENGDENSITETVFIGEKDYPVVGYKVKNKSNETIRQKEECYVGKTTVPAYKVTRYESITIDPSDSVNTKGLSTDLKFFFQPKYGEIYNSTTFKHSFNELGCTYVDLTVEDTAKGVNAQQRIYFKVYNGLPTIDNITLSFPQYGNEVGIGLNQTSQETVQDIFNGDTDLTVKVTAANAKDSDGFISYFKWYYYYKDDPSRRLETKITPSNVNYTYFQLKEAGEYMFGVTVYDNDEGKTSSEELLGNGPTVLLIQDTRNIDIPIVTLKSNKTTVEVGDEVTFNVVSKIISDRADFVQERTIRYDFDGDGERDLITKDDQVTYVYEKPNADGYIPRAGVLYRGYEGTAKGGSIVVKDALKPRLLTVNAGKFVLFRDISLGEIAKSSTCLSLVDCKANKDGYWIDSKDTTYYTFEYPDYQKYFISMDLQDEYANAVNKTVALELTGVKTNDGNIVNYKGDIKILTLPEYYEKPDGTIEIFVGNNLKNSVLFYVLDEKGMKNCYVDTDLSDDEEKDFACNEIFLKEYTPQYSSKVGKIHYEKDGKEITKEFTVSFLDYSVKLTEKQQEYYDKISELYDTVKDENLKKLLLNLKEGIVSDTETQENTIAIYDYLTSEHAVEIDDLQKQELTSIVNDLSDATVVSAMGGTEYDIAKAEILGVLPRNLRVTVKGLFNDFEVAESNFEKGTSQQDERKEKLQEILTLIKSKSTSDLNNQKEDEIAKSDLDDIVVPNICKIMTYYNIASNGNLCGDTNSIQIPEVTDVEKPQKSKNKLSTGLKVLIISLSSLIGVFVILVIFFAIKAKITRQKEEEE